MEKVNSNDYYLWERFKEGNDAAFYDLYDQYADALYRYGIHFSGDRGFVKDCIQSGNCTQAPLWRLAWVRGSCY